MGKIKGSNLNIASTASKTEDKKSKAKDQEDEGWKEDEVSAPTIGKVEAVGKLVKDDEKPQEEDATAPAWGKLKQPVEPKERSTADQKRFPSLAKSIQSSNINIDDSEPKVNIATSKNAFSALENEDDEDQEGKRPKEIKPAMVQKKQGEREKIAIQREVDKYSTKKDDGKKDDEEDEDEDGEEPKAEEEAKEAKEVAEVKKTEKKEEKKTKSPQAEEPQKEIEEDLKIQAD